MNTETKNVPVIDGDEILEGVLRWVDIESPSHEGDAVNHMVDHVEEGLAVLGLQVSRTPGRHGFGDILSALFFFAAAYVAYTFVLISMDAGDKAPVLYFVIWPLQLVLPYAFGSAGVKHLIYGLRPDLKPYSGEVRG